MKATILHRFYIGAMAALLSVSANADVIKTVGSSGADFTTLTAAFSAINSDLSGTTYSGAIQLQIIDNITNNSAAINNKYYSNENI